MRRYVILAGLAFAGLIIVAWTAPAFAAAPARPNVVFILADDLGWADTTPYGSTYHETPNIARLARRGTRFTQAYAANPLCSPTRASILTGLYPCRIGITTPAGHLPEAVLQASLPARAPPHHKAIAPRTATRLKREYRTLAEALKEAGYATGHFGKWHLGREPYDPRQQGFDVDLPHTPGPGPAGGYLGPWRFWPDQGRPGEHIEDRMASEAAAWMRANRDRPFFLNYWAFSVHSPWQAKPEYVEEYARKAAPGSAQRNPVYAGMVRSLDDAVGRLLHALDELRLSERTILVFFSDNGGWIWPARSEGFDSRFQEVPVTSNAPLRGGKATLYEGGTRVPCIVVWPGVTRPGAVSAARVQSVDWFPTLIEMLGLKPAPGQTFDGISIVPALKGRRLGRDTLFCHFPHYTPATGNVPGTWVRRGDWKLIRFYSDNSDQTHRFELYNLREDPGETRDLAAAHPARVRDLDALISGHLKETGALVPVPNPAYDKSASPPAANTRER